MRSNKFAATLITICIMLLGVVAVADQNQFGVANSYRITFLEQVRVGDALLPAGNYEIRHEMQGQDHIMVFQQLGVKKPVEVRAKCTLVPLPEKARDSQKVYQVNAKNERVLQELVFRGDSSKHVF